MKATTIKFCTAIIASAMAATVAMADHVWNTDVASGSWTDTANWVGDSGNWVIKVNDAQVTFPSLVEVATEANGGIWIENGDTLKPVVFKLADGVETGGITSTNALTVGTGTAGALKIESGAYSFTHGTWDDWCTWGGTGGFGFTLEGGSLAMPVLTTKGNGTIAINGGSFTTSGVLKLAEAKNVEVNLNVSGGTLGVGGILAIAPTANGTGSMTVSGGAVAITGNNNMGGAGTANMTVSGGVVTNNDWTCVGAGSGAATLTVSGTGRYVQAVNAVIVGQADNTGSGTLNVSDNGQIETTNFFIAENQDGTVTLNGGLVAVSNKIYFNKNDKSKSAALNVNSGATLAFKYTEFGTGSNTINANGGVFAPLKASSDLLSGATITIGENGLVISNDVAVTLSATLQAASGVSAPKLVKLGGGALTISEAQMGVLDTVEVKGGAVIFPDGTTTSDTTATCNSSSVTISANGGHAWAPATTGYTLLGETAASGAIYWVGGSDSSWNTAANWSGGVVPNITKDDKTQYSVVIPDGALITDANKTVASMTLEGAATFQNPDWGSLIVTTAFTKKNATKELHLHSIDFRNNTSSTIDFGPVKVTGSCDLFGDAFRIGNLTGTGLLSAWDSGFSLYGDNSNFEGSVGSRYETWGNASTVTFESTSAGLPKGALVHNHPTSGNFKTAFDSGTIQFGAISNVNLKAETNQDTQETTYTPCYMKYISNGANANVTIEVGGGKLVFGDSFDGAMTVKKAGTGTLEFSTDQSNVSLEVAGTFAPSENVMVNTLTVDDGATLDMTGDYTLTASTATLASGAVVKATPGTADAVKLSVTGAATVNASFPVNISDDTVAAREHLLMKVGSLSGTPVLDNSGTNTKLLVGEKTVSASDYVAIWTHSGLVIILR